MVPTIPVDVDTITNSFWNGATIGGPDSEKPESEASEDESETDGGSPSGPESSFESIGDGRLYPGAHILDPKWC